MCELCGCGLPWSVKRSLRQERPKGKAVAVRVKAAPAEPKPAVRATRPPEKPRPVREDLRQNTFDPLR